MSSLEWDNSSVWVKVAGGLCLLAAGFLSYLCAVNRATLSLFVFLTIASCTIIALSCFFELPHCKYIFAIVYSILALFQIRYILSGNLLILNGLGAFTIFAGYALIIAYVVGFVEKRYLVIIAAVLVVAGTFINMIWYPIYISNRYYGEASVFPTITIKTDWTKIYLRNLIRSTLGLQIMSYTIPAISALFCMVIPTSVNDDQEDYYSSAM